MASAAHRVFAIPELLESILLSIVHLHSNDDEYCDGPCTAIAKLFALQRVSKHYRAVIATSPDLRRVLHLDYQTSQDELYFTGLHYFFRHRTGFWPNAHIHNRFTPSSYSPEARLQGGALIYSLMPSYSITAHGGEDMDQDYAEHQPSSSWAQMKLTSKPTRVIFGMRVNVRSNGERRLLASYVAIFFFERETETLGEFYSALDTVARRSVEEHVAFSERFDRVQAMHREGHEDLDGLKESHAEVGDCGKALGQCHVCACEGMRQPPLAYL